MAPRLRPAKNRFWVVCRGRSLGILKSRSEWDEAVRGFSRAKSRAFVTLRDAKAHCARHLLRARPRQRGRDSDSMMAQASSIAAAASSSQQFQLPQFDPPQFQLPQFDPPNLQITLSNSLASRNVAVAEHKPVRYATLYVDGASRNNPGEGGAGAVLYDYGSDPQCRPVRHSFSRYLGRATNNEAEYQALIMGLREALNLGVTHLTANSDSELVVRQVPQKGPDSYGTYAPNLIPLCEEVRWLSKQFISFTLVHISGKSNIEADALAKEASRTNG